MLLKPNFSIGVNCITGDTVVTRPNCKHCKVVVPKGHCWVEGDNHSKSMDRSFKHSQNLLFMSIFIYVIIIKILFDSNIFGPVALGLISAISLYIIWPPNRWKKLEISMPSDRNIIVYKSNKCLISVNYQDIRVDESHSLVEPN